MPEKQMKKLEPAKKQPEVPAQSPKVAVEEDGDSIEITVPKLKVERIKMKFGGVRTAIHDADK